MYLEIGWKIYQRTSYFVFWVIIFYGGGWELNFHVKCNIGYNYASVICNHCFTQAPEQGGNSLANVLWFYFYIVSIMRKKCRGLIDIATMAVQYNNRLSWFCQLAVPTVWWLSIMGNCRYKMKVTKWKSSTFPWAGGGGGAVVTNDYCIKANWIMHTSHL